MAKTRKQELERRSKATRWMAKPGTKQDLDVLKWVWFLIVTCDQLNEEEKDHVEKYLEYRETKSVAG